MHTDGAHAGLPRVQGSHTWQAHVSAALVHTAEDWTHAWGGTTQVTLLWMSGYSADDSLMDEWVLQMTRAWISGYYREGYDLGYDACRVLLRGVHMHTVRGWYENVESDWVPQVWRVSGSHKCEE